MKAFVLVLLLAILQISSVESFSTTSTAAAGRHSSTKLVGSSWSAPVPALSTPPLSLNQPESPLFRASASSSRLLLLLASSRRANSDDLNDDDEDESEEAPLKFSRADHLVAATSSALRRASWLSWWCQMILTVTSAVILGFAKNVVNTGSSSLLRGSEPKVNFLLAGTGIVISFMSIFWTWGGGARLSRRLIRRPTTQIKTANLLRRAIRVGVTLNLVGMLTTLLGAEQTVGVLAIKVLTAGRTGMNPMMAATLDGLQPLDILVVQANTNLLLSHFCSLVSLLYLTGFVSKLDPPSSEDGNKNGSGGEVRQRQ